MARRHKRSPRSHSRYRRPSKLSTLNYFSRKHPIATGVLLIISAFLVFRFGFEILNNPEAAIWIWLTSIGLFIAGVLVLVGWWRNHISMLITRHNVRWK